MDAPYYNGSDDREDTCTEDFDLCPCPDCETWRSNREPEDDGEAFRGGEAQAYEAEQQHAAQRIK